MFKKAVLQTQLSSVKTLFQKTLSMLRLLKPVLQTKKYDVSIRFLKEMIIFQFWYNSWWK